MHSNNEDNASRAFVPPVCEGWLEKYGLGRSFFSRRGWARRYFSLTYAGLGYSHSNPRLKRGTGGAAAKNGRLSEPAAAAAAEAGTAECLPCSLSPSRSRCFIPFQTKRRYEVQLLPVYFLRDISALHHPALPWSCKNGICQRPISDDVVRGAAASHSEAQRHRHPYCTSKRALTSVSAKGGSSFSSTHDTLTTTTNGAATQLAGNEGNCNGGDGAEDTYYYYFGLSFEEGQRRYVMLLRTSSAREYVKWTTCLPLYVHEASARTIVPTAHPLSVGHHGCTDVTFRRLARQGGGGRPQAAPVAQAPDLTTFPDPDPCGYEEYTKARARCLSWDEGQMGRVVGGAGRWLSSVVLGDGSVARAVLRAELATSEPEHRARLLQRANACLAGPIVDAKEEDEAGTAAAATSAEAQGGDVREGDGGVAEGRHGVRGPHSAASHEALHGSGGDVAGFTTPRVSPAATTTTTLVVGTAVPQQRNSPAKRTPLPRAVFVAREVRSPRATTLAATNSSVARLTEGGANVTRTRTYAIRAAAAR